MKVNGTIIRRMVKVVLFIQMVSITLGISLMINRMEKEHSTTTMAQHFEEIFEMAKLVMEME